ncbi:hypothetical protein Asppvi_010125 [Aspergillus pseudoviridinutans]|uniref:Phospholipase C n=1 Tax=Aspergillus pseudoviridinutans TaxID=1517512 RepID=A0A9P3BH59_9EURO|nr:uncharacterized protein Asppvi_010125 [Aspergillus pseudoviridinutans]GIJ91160.1 hypothetical protein Asppvi_010125 [Aspergillus pseudoviridinutans]
MLTAVSEWESPDHIFLGDGITLRLDKHEPAKQAKEVHFALPNGEKLTYGEISALAGDFFGTWKPISDAPDPEERTRCFISAWESLAVETRLKSEIRSILYIINEQKAAVEQAIKHGRHPSEVYKSPLWDIRFQNATQGRKNQKLPTYLDLARLDWDHFGLDARLSYNTGHAVAIEIAKKGTQEALLTAYAINAFADHFLQDSFSAGHIRTPRRALHFGDNVDVDNKAKLMHDEDGEKGLHVSSRTQCKWTMYGDMNFLDKENKENREYCHQAVQSSVNEIFEAWKDGESASPKDYKAWTYAPDIKTAFSPHNHTPMFSIQERPKQRPWYTQIYDYILSIG